jgi:acyl carrier protein
MAMDSASITARLSDFHDGVLMGDNQDVLNTLDSLELIQLIKFIEDTFGIRVGLEEVTIVSFSDLQSITALVESKRNSGKL